MDPCFGISIYVLLSLIFIVVPLWMSWYGGMWGWGPLWVGRRVAAKLAPAWIFPPSSHTLHHINHTWFLFPTFSFLPQTWFSRSSHHHILLNCTIKITIDFQRCSITSISWSKYHLLSFFSPHKPHLISQHFHKFSVENEDFVRLWNDSPLKRICAKPFIRYKIICQ